MTNIIHKSFDPSILPLKMYPAVIFVYMWNNVCTRLFQTPKIKNSLHIHQWDTSYINYGTSLEYHTTVKKNGEAFSDMERYTRYIVNGKKQGAEQYNILPFR